MNYEKKDIDSLRMDLDSNKITSIELFNKANFLAHKYQDEYNSFVTIIDKYKMNKKTSI